jgi:hypothetical protein
MICDQTCIQAHFKTVQEKQQQKIKNNKEARCGGAYL